MSVTPRGKTDGATVPLMSKFAGDPDMSELVDLFVGEMPERVAQIETLWTKQSLEDLRRVAHQLKGASAGYGFGPVGDAAGKLEQTLIVAVQSSGSAAEQALNAAKEEVSELMAVCRRVRAR